MQCIDPNFNIYVGEVGKWLPFNPDVNGIQNNEYLNEGLNDMMKAYHENQEKGRNPLKNNKNHEKLRIPLENYVNHENLRIS